MNLWWRFVHNVVAHPAMFFFNDAKWTVKFHDWSREKMAQKYPQLYTRNPDRK